MSLFDIRSTLFYETEKWGRNEHHSDREESEKNKKRYRRNNIYKKDMAPIFSRHKILTFLIVNTSKSGFVSCEYQTKSCHKDK